MWHGRARKGEDRLSINFLHRVAVSSLIMLLVLSGDAIAKQKNGKATVTKSKNGLHFQVPDDWPIEERGGIVAPIPIEEYLARKFEKLELRIRTIEQSLSGIDLRLRVLEEKSKAAEKKLRSVESIAR